MFWSFARARIKLFALRPVPAVAVCVLALAAACSTSPESIDFPEPSFESFETIWFDVAELRVSSNYHPPLEPPNVDHRFPVSLSGAAMRWAHERLIAGGDNGEAAFVIEDASVVETELDVRPGVTGLFHDEPAYRYDGRLAVRLVVVQDGRTSEAQAVVTRSQTVQESATLNERNAVWYQMMDRMLVDMNAEMEKNIGIYLKAFTQ